MKAFRKNTVGLMGCAGLWLVACNEPARQPATVESPTPPPSGLPGTPSGPRPSDAALNAPEQTAPVPLNPKAAAAADSLAPAPKPTAPFVERTVKGALLPKKKNDPVGTRMH